MHKKISAVILAALMLPQYVTASVLGSENISAYSYDISHGTTLHENVFLSDQSGVGLQSEYFAEYTPNSDTVPVVVTGESIYGKRTADEAVKYMQDNGMRPMLGINASFFSLSTGVPMGHVISNGKVVSKDSSTLQSVGFSEQYGAFIAPLAIDIDLQTEYGGVGIANLNKLNVASLPWISMYTPAFGDQTHNDVESFSVILDVVDSDLTIGGTVSATVIDKFIYTGGLKIDENKLILSINTGEHYDYHYNLLNSLEVGDKVTISCSAQGDERWAGVQNAIGSQGEILVKDGVANTNFVKGAAPRTAVGITADGKVIFYVLDGRQPGHSYGAQLKTLAARMIELGCVDAINFDGGGSTSISGVYPGADSIAVLNSPSDGRLRKVPNFIFLQNLKEATGELKDIYVTPQQKKYLSGTKVALSARGIDTAYFGANIGEVSYSVPEPSTAEGNIITLRGSGTVEVTATHNAVSTISHHYVYDMPDKIVVLSDGKSVDSLNLSNGASVRLSAEAYSGSSKLISDSECFTYSVEGNIGTISADGVFTANADRTTEGSITVTAAQKSISIPVRVVNDDYIFTDIQDHWAKEMIRDLARNGIISGYEQEQGLVFCPDNSITRAEFAVLLAKYLNLDTNAFTVSSDVFADEIPAWAQGAVHTMYQLGYISGKDAGYGVIFAASDKITRAEAATIIGKTQPLMTEESPLAFTDIDEIPKWAYGFISRLVNASIISGYSDNTVKPQNSVTRAEAATMLYKLSATVSE